MSSDVDNELPPATLYKYSNQKDSHYLDNLLAMFYNGVNTNRVGIMQALNKGTNEEEVILVGVGEREDGTQDCFPLALVLKAEDVGNYSAPDGQGGWKNLGPDDN